MTPKNYKLDIFSTLNQINEKRPHFFSGLSEEEKKGFVPLVVMRWMSGTTSPLQIILLNEVVNPFVFPLAGHKELLYKLMTMSSIGRQKNKWIKSESTKTHKHPNCIEIIKNHYGYNTSHAIEALSLIPPDVILEMADAQGVQKDIMVKIKVELNQK